MAITPLSSVNSVPVVSLLPSPVNTYLLAITPRNLNADSVDGIAPTVNTADIENTPAALTAQNLNENRAASILDVEDIVDLSAEAQIALANAQAAEVLPGPEPSVPQTSYANTARSLALYNQYNLSTPFSTIRDFTSFPMQLAGALGVTGYRRPDQI